MSGASSLQAAGRSALDDSRRCQVMVLPVSPIEAWPSIELCSEMLVRHLSAQASLSVQTPSIEFPRRFLKVPWLGKTRIGQNADRMLHRFLDYPSFARRATDAGDLFHVCDHSYAHLIHSLPSARCGVLCQDLDTFHCVLEPRLNSRPAWFRWMTRRILDGFRKAAVVFYTTQHVRSQIEDYGLVDSERLVHAPLGIAPEFIQPLETSQAALATIPRQPYLLHVGSCIARKRIDVLLNVVAGVRSRRDTVRLVKVGGTFSDEQRKQINRLKLGDAIVHLSGVPRTELAGLYQHAAATMVTSDREGFGLPVIEALACGSVVVANDLPPLREGGGEAAIYCSISDVDGWIDRLVSVLDNPTKAPPLDIRRAHALQFTWEAHARAIGRAYEQMVSGCRQVA